MRSEKSGLAELDPEWLEAVLLKFVEQCVPDENLSNFAASVVSPTDIEIWDGKTLRGTRKRDQRAEQVLVRMQRALRKLLASHTIPAETNESSAALDLVRRLVER